MHPPPACVLYAGRYTQDNAGWLTGIEKKKKTGFGFFSSMKQETPRLEEHVLYGLCSKSTWCSLKGFLYPVPPTRAVPGASLTRHIHCFIAVGGTGSLTPGENSDKCLHFELDGPVDPSDF